MDVPRNATDLILLARIADVNDDPIVGIAHDDPLLSISAFAFGFSAFEEITLFPGEIGQYIANSWAEVTDGVYQFCPANELIVSGRSTVILARYDERTTFGHINAIGETIDQDSLLGGLLTGLSSVSITRIGPEFEPGTRTVTIYQGDDYLAANGNALTFAITLPGVDLASASAVFAADSLYSSVLMGTATLIDTNTNNPKLRLEWSRAQTLAVAASDKLSWGVAIVDAGKKVQTIIGGPLKLKRALVNPGVTQAVIES